MNIKSISWLTFDCLFHHLKWRCSHSKDNWIRVFCFLFHNFRLIGLISRIYKTIKGGLYWMCNYILIMLSALLYKELGRLQQSWRCYMNIRVSSLLMQCCFCRNLSFDSCWSFLVSFFMEFMNSSMNFILRNLLDLMPMYCINWFFNNLLVHVIVNILILNFFLLFLLPANYTAFLHIYYGFRGIIIWLSFRSYTRNWSRRELLQKDWGSWRWYCSWSNCVSVLIIF